MSISPNVPSPDESYRYESTGTPRWIPVLFVILFVVIAALGYVGYSGISRVEGNLAKEQDNNKVLTAQLEQANARLADLKGHIEVTEQKVGMTVSELAQAKSRGNPSARSNSPRIRSSPHNCLKLKRKARNRLAQSQRKSAARRRISRQRRVTSKLPRASSNALPVTWAS